MTGSNLTVVIKISTLHEVPLSTNMGEEVCTV